MAFEGKRQAKIQAEQQGAVREDRRVLLLCISSATLFPFASLLLFDSPSGFARFYSAFIHLNLAQQQLTWHRTQGPHTSCNSVQNV